MTFSVYHLAQSAVSSLRRQISVKLFQKCICSDVHHYDVIFSKSADLSCLSLVLTVGDLGVADLTIEVAGLTLEVAGFSFEIAEIGFHACKPRLHIRHYRSLMTRTGGPGNRDRAPNPAPAAA